MNNINFEKDQEEILDKTKNIKSLADEVKKLKSLEDQIKSDEESLKEKKKELELISGEVIPTMFQKWDYLLLNLQMDLQLM